MASRRYTIQTVIYPGDEKGYVGECLDLAVVTQGATLDETAQNFARQLNFIWKAMPICRAAT